jgi:NlpC/P60 family putative phage cell wall peptidase
MSRPSALASDGFRSLVVQEARAWIGTPYRHQASLRGVGCDCLGLVRGVWRNVVGAEPESPPPYSPDWAEATGAEQLLAAAERHFVPTPRNDFGAGDLLLFRWRSNLPAKHLAIATGAGTMVHAHEGASVCEVAISQWWMRHLAGAFSFPATGASAVRTN